MAGQKMRVIDGDSVLVDSDRDHIGLVESRDGLKLRVRFPAEGNTQDFDRELVRPVAEAIAESVRRGSKYARSFSYIGHSPLSDLIARFGYTADQRLRQDTLEKVSLQLARAGIRLEFDSATRESPFTLTAQQDSSAIAPSKAKPRLEAGVVLPQMFWPQAMGLDRADELPFLRALSEAEPILALLHTSRAHASWLVPTWEGLLSWAYTSAQRFLRANDDTRSDGPSVVVRPVSALQQFVKPTGREADALALDPSSRRLNLVCIDLNSELSDLARLQARWPGPVFEFRPDPIKPGDELTSASWKSLVSVLCVAGGRPDAAEHAFTGSPLKLLLWARRGQRQILASAAAAVRELGLLEASEKLRGGNELSLALALKVITGAWVARLHPKSKLSFEQRGEGDDGHRRYDLVAKGVGTFEIETMLQSGPHEHFQHHKVIGRLGTKAGAPTFHLVVPSDAVIWAGPYLADIAHRLVDHGHVMIPHVETSEEGANRLCLIALAGASLDRYSLDVKHPADAVGVDLLTKKAEVPLKLDDVAGYDAIRQLIRDEVIWVHGNASIARSASRAGGILFFGPPGCGKTRIARATCGELGHEVRMLSPADLKGLYVGWGQHLIREQFDWLFEDDNRILVIDEVDAVARSRAHTEMHSDEKADVNELLVQLDRAGRLGRLVLSTTNFVRSLDEAVIRSGRVGHFVAVGPPDPGAACDVVSYYLDKLGSGSDGNPNPFLKIVRPSRAEVDDLVTTAILGRPGEGAFCCADLEEVVNRTFRQLARAAKAAEPALSADEPRPLEVDVTAWALRKGFAQARRSITADSLVEFVADVETYCSREMIEQVQMQLRELERP